MKSLLGSIFSLFYSLICSTELQSSPCSCSPLLLSNPKIYAVYLTVLTENMGFLPAGIEIKFEIHPRCTSFRCSQKECFCSKNGQYLVVDIGDRLSQCDLIEGISEISPRGYIFKGRFFRAYIAGLHVTSRRPWWWLRKKAFLSSGN